MRLTYKTPSNIGEGDFNRPSGRGLYEQSFCPEPIRKAFNAVSSCPSTYNAQGEEGICEEEDPFTIQLTIPVKEKLYPITLGVDAGYRHIGLSATTEKEELYASEIETRADVSALLSTRRQCRRGRRNRKTRYRAPRFNNRVHSKHKGWLAPSVENIIAAHISRIEDVLKLLPVTRIVIETASFDIQLIRNPEISGAQYQQGEQLGSWNTREYVLCRDGHTCQHCHGKSKDQILQVHHLESRRTGGDAPTISLPCAKPAMKRCIGARSNSRQSEVGLSEQRPS